MVSSTSLHHDWCYLRHCRNAHSMRKWLSQSILRILTGRIQIIIIINRLLIWIRLFTSMIDFYSSLTLEIIRIISYWTDRLLFLTDNEVVICVDCQQQNEYSLYDLYLFIHYWYWQCLRRLYWSFSCHIIILRAMPYDREGLSLSAYINNNSNSENLSDEKSTLTGNKFVVAVLSHHLNDESYSLLFSLISNAVIDK